ncbi:RNA polymerase sigma-70 factor [Sunxiuqinia sp. sy24]|uniref:RNA polymerase sigma-70 factor n=1 Tax=Sunxiuqinia sp. sy24 TaxID=3461495 RepID=UPI004045741B
MDFESLALKIRNGDSSAFDLLFYKNYEGLCNYAYSFIKDYAASEDLIQDIFVNIWTSRTDIDPSKFNKAYIFRSVYNSCLDFLKHQAVKEKYQFSQATDHNEHFHDSLEDFELTQHIELAIQKLPQKRREIFCLSRFDGLKYKEIATQLDISENTVDTQIRRALKFLRDELKHHLVILFSFFYHLY